MQRHFGLVGQTSGMMIVRDGLSRALECSRTITEFRGAANQYVEISCAFTNDSIPPQGRPNPIVDSLEMESSIYQCEE